MRLKRVERGSGPKNRLLLLAIRLVTRRRVADVIRTLIYRSPVFGQPFRRWLQTVIRGPSPWSLWERELFAAFTSKLNRCHF